MKQILNIICIHGIKVLCISYIKEQFWHYYFMNYDDLAI